MIESHRLLKSVLAALHGIRAHAVAETDFEEFDTAVYDRWIRILDTAIEIDCAELVLTDQAMHRSDFLMNLSASIAFLECYEQSDNENDAAGFAESAADPVNGVVVRMEDTGEPAERRRPLLWSPKSQ